MFIFLKKGLICLASATTIYNQKSHFLLAGSGTAITYSPLNTKPKFFTEVFQYILKSLETFLIPNYFYTNAKKYK